MGKKHNWGVALTMRLSMGVNLSELGNRELPSDTSAFPRLMFHCLGPLLFEAQMFLLNAMVPLNPELGQEPILPQPQHRCQLPGGGPVG